MGKRVLWVFLFSFVLIPELFSQSASLPHYWVYFRDRGPSDVNPNAIDPQSLGISARALKRRTKVLPLNKLIDERDLPVSEAYINELRSRGLAVHVTSRWLNAVSVSGSSDQIQGLLQLPFVRSFGVVPVVHPPTPEVAPLHEASTFQKGEKTTGLNYGPSITQLANIKVPDVHNLGIFGSGVLVGMIDDGFNSHKTHNALKNIPILAEYDWVQADSNTSISPGEFATQGNHGCYTLSALAGFDSGHLIGPAFGATLVLAKTEVDSTETQIELDRYVVALEWMERLGADVVSTSLGYDDLDPAGVYNSGDIVYSMKNGHTAVTSIAGSTAASKGVLLVTAMGNEGPWRYDNNWKIISGTTGSLITPADADSIIAVGATYSDGFLADFSSTGPTAEGRTKPEVVAQGVSVVSANPSNISGYLSVSGTSLSTPLTGGVAALIFSAHPELTPMQVREALISTAVHINDTDPTKNITGWPNNWYGYGMINSFDAVLYHGLVFSNRPVVISSDTTMTIRVWIKSKNTLLSDSLFLYYKRPVDATFTRVLLSPSGSADQFLVRVSKGLIDSTSVGYFSATDNSGKTRKAPYNAPDSLFSMAPTPDSILGIYPPLAGLPQQFVLYPNFPNPFNGYTSIRFDVPQTATVKLEIYNLLGQKVRTLFNGRVDIGTKTSRWDGLDDSGRIVTSGVYFYRLSTPTSSITKKLLYVR